jgi:hypothetical protein
MKILKGKCHGVVMTVLSFGNIFGNESVRQMTVDTGCDDMMAGLLPEVILRVHDVTVCAGARIGTGIILVTDVEFW